MPGQLISDPSERRFCAMGCGSLLIQTAPGTRSYPDLCTSCEQKMIRHHMKRGKLSVEFVNRLKR